MEIDKENKCDYCEKKYSTKYTLAKHLKNCKTLKKIEEKEKYVSINIKEYNKLKKAQEKIKMLEQENKELNIKLIKLETENNIYKSQNKEQSQSILDIAKQPKTKTINNFKQKTFNLRDKEFVKDVQDKLRNNIDRTHILNGQKGMARLLFENCLKDENGENSKYICSDISRGIFKFTDDEGNSYYDNKAKKISNIVYSGVKDTINSINEDDSKNNTDFIEKIIDIKNITEDNSNFRNELITLSTLN